MTLIRSILIPLLVIIKLKYLIFNIYYLYFFISKYKLALYSLFSILYT